MSIKLIRHQNWNITKTEMLLKLICHQNLNVTKLKGHQKWSFTKTELSPKLKCDQNWNVTKTESLPNIIMSSKIKIKIQEIGTEHLGLVPSILSQVCEAAEAVCGQEARDSYIRARMYHREERPV